MGKHHEQHCVYICYFIDPASSSYSMCSLISHWFVYCLYISLSVYFFLLIFSYEFRWEAKRFELDDAIVSCALKRSGCTYSGDILIGCTAALDDTYLAGYLVHVELKRIFRNRRKYPAIDDNFVDDGEYPKTWWAVKSCHAVAFEVYMINHFL